MSSRCGGTTNQRKEARIWRVRSVVDVAIPETQRCPISSLDDSLSHFRTRELIDDQPCARAEQIRVSMCHRIEAIFGTTEEFSTWQAIDDVDVASCKDGEVAFAVSNELIGASVIFPPVTLDCNARSASVNQKVEAILTAERADWNLGDEFQPRAQPLDGVMRKSPFNRAVQAFGHERRNNGRQQVHGDFHSTSAT